MSVNHSSRELTYADAEHNIHAKAEPEEADVAPVVHKLQVRQGAGMAEAG